MPLQFRKGPESSRSSITPLMGEPLWTTDTNVLYIGNGVSPGGVVVNAGSSNSSNTATNIAGGTAGQVPYQTGAGVTSFYGPGTSGQILVSGGTGAPVYTNTSSIYVGRAVDADKWSTARTITFTGDTTGTFTIDGSANVSNVNLAIQPNSVALGANTTGDYVATGATSGFGLSGSTTGENQTFTVASNATSTNANSTLVFRDGSGNFSAGTITASLTGVSTTATNIAGGDIDQLPIQSATGITTFITTSSLYVGRSVTTDNVNEVFLTTSSNTVLNTSTTFVFASGEITLTLPSAIEIPSKKYNIRNSGINSITVVTSIGQTINGYANMTITETNSVMGLLSDGANWIIF